MEGSYAPSLARPRSDRANGVGPGIVLSEGLTGLHDTMDDELVRSAAAGDRRACEQLLRAVLPRVRNLVRYLVRGDRDVDDISQEALVALVRGLPGYRADGSFRAWSDRIVARTTFAYLRRHRAREQHQVSYAPVLLPAAEDSDVHRRLVARRAAVRLLDQLPEEQRSVLVLHHVLGLGVAEIAKELDAPFETVRSRLRLGKAKLRSLQDEGDGE